MTLNAKGIRYRQPTGPEADAQPGSRGRVPLNRLGLISKRALDLAEAEALLRTQEDYYERLTPDTRFNAELIRQMHRHWLGEIYEWAGQYRQVELEKEGFRWPPTERVPENMRQLELGPLREFTPCRPAPLDEVVKGIAVVHAELLLIHPFRDGNGRLARWLASLMAVQAGYPAPLYNFARRGSRKRREAYVAAVQEGYLQNYLPLEAFFRGTILRRGDAGR